MVNVFRHVKKRSFMFWRFLNQNCFDACENEYFEKQSDCRVFDIRSSVTFERPHHVQTPGLEQNSRSIVRGHQRYLTNVVTRLKSLRSLERTSRSHATYICCRKTSSFRPFIRRSPRDVVTFLRADWFEIQLYSRKIGCWNAEVGLQTLQKHVTIGLVTCLPFLGGYDTDMGSEKAEIRLVVSGHRCSVGHVKSSTFDRSKTKFLLKLESSDLHW